MAAPSDAGPPSAPPPHRKPGLIRRMVGASGRGAVAVVQHIAVRAGALALVGGVVGGVIVYRRRMKENNKEKLPKILYLHVGPEGLLDVPRPSSSWIDVAQGSVKAQHIRHIVNALDSAGKDPSVHGLVANLGNANICMAHAEEISAAVLRFRMAKKTQFTEYFREWVQVEATPGSPAAVVKEKMDAAGNNVVVTMPVAVAFGTNMDQNAYYLASAFDKVYLQPNGALELCGIASEPTFFKQMLEKLGINIQAFKRKEYKSFVEPFTRTKFSDPAKLNRYELVTGLHQKMIDSIAKRRSKTAQQVSAVVDEGILDTPTAIASGLIDGAAYKDQAIANAVTMAAAGYQAQHRLEAPTQKAQMVNLRHYAWDMRRKELKAAIMEDGEHSVVAIIGAAGSVSGESGRGFNAPQLEKAFNSALKDEHVKAIVFRIDSPGGEAVAAGTIARYVERAQEKGVPVVASLGPVAASGGYYVAAPCQRIIALPSTITGSIGVASLKPVLEEKFWSRLGITFDPLYIGRNADMHSVLKPFNDHQVLKIEAMMDRTYHEFVNIVATGRKMNYKAAELLARGKVYTGKQAMAIGLVDEMGGYRDAVNAAKKLAKLEGTVMEKVYPKEPVVDDALELLSDWDAREYDESERRLSVGAFEKLVLEPLATALRQHLLRKPATVLVDSGERPA